MFYCIIELYIYMYVYILIIRMTYSVAWKYWKGLQLLAEIMFQRVLSLLKIYSTHCSFLLDLLLLLLCLLSIKQHMILQFVMLLLQVSLFGLFSLVSLAQFVFFLILSFWLSIVFLFVVVLPLVLEWLLMVFQSPSFSQHYSTFSDLLS